MPTPDGSISAPSDPITGWRLTRLEFLLDTGGAANFDARLIRQSGAYASQPVTMSITGKDYDAMLQATQISLGAQELGLTIEGVLRLRVANCPNVQAIINSRLGPIAAQSASDVSLSPQ